MNLSAQWQPTYDVAVQIADHIFCITANNPSAYTLQGTNTWIIKPPGQRSIVIDPGPECAKHLEALMCISSDQPLIVHTHSHADHNALSAKYAQYCKAEILSLYPLMKDKKLIDLNHYGAPGLYALFTPGHSDDSISFVYLTNREKATPEDSRLENPPASSTRHSDWPLLTGQACSVFIGDTILGHGSTVLLASHEPLATYFNSLELLRSLPDPTFFAPGHGLWHDNVHKKIESTLLHRERQLQKIIHYMQKHPSISIENLTSALYPNLHGALISAAIASVRNQLEYLNKYPDLPSGPRS